MNYLPAACMAMFAMNIEGFVTVPSALVAGIVTILSL